MLFFEIAHQLFPSGGVDRRISSRPQLAANQVLVHQTVRGAPACRGAEVQRVILDDSSDADFLPPLALGDRILSDATCDALDHGGMHRRKQQQNSYSVPHGWCV